MQLVDDRVDLVSELIAEARGVGRQLPPGCTPPSLPVPGACTFDLIAVEVFSVRVADSWPILDGQQLASSVHSCLGRMG